MLQKSMPVKAILNKLIYLFYDFWLLFLLIFLIAVFGTLIQYSAGEGSFRPWAGKHISRFYIFLVISITISLIDLRFWYSRAYLIYFLSLVPLIMVEFFGFIGMGAKRWLNLYFVSLQPSEFIKLSLIIALARYYCEDATSHVIPIITVAFPVLLVLHQPDLGTAMILALVGFSMIFLVGIQIRKLIISGILGLMAIPIFWLFLHDYQKSRIFNFINPENDPFGSGYQLLQSKIALGSGGFFGKGFLAGTQSHLNFLPIKHNDFIFTMLCEEFGFLGGVFLLLLYAFSIIICFKTSLHSKSRFGKIMGFGIVALLFVHVFINISMVMGLVPVVGVPLPLVSYGGSSMLVFMVSIGIISAIGLCKNFRLGS